MIAATLFSGIGAPEVAMPHWNWLWHAEIEKFPSAVMAARHPQSVNLGDVTAHDFCERASAIAKPNVLIFGSPCQSYSIAGKRLGMDDPRGNMALVALGIVARLKPDWFVFENVPGLFSSWSGEEEGPVSPGAEWDSEENSDFVAFLSYVDELRYSGAWTVLDAQYRGVAQRRNRVFFVGHIGDWRAPCAVLLEPESLCGNSPPSRQAGQGIAHDVASSLVSSGRGVERAGETRGQDPVVVFSTVDEISHCLNAGGMGRQDYETETLIAHALRAEGFDASEDGTGRGTPLVPMAVALRGRADGATAELGDDKAFALRSSGGGGDKPHVLAFDTTQITSKGNYSEPKAGMPCHPLARTAHPPAIAFSSKDYGADAETDLCPTLRSGGHDKSHANAGVPPAIAQGGGPQANASRVRTASRISRRLHADRLSRQTGGGRISLQGHRKFHGGAGDALDSNAHRNIRTRHTAVDRKVSRMTAALAKVQSRFVASRVTSGVGHMRKQLSAEALAWRLPPPLCQSSPVAAVAVKVPVRPEIAVEDLSQAQMLAMMQMSDMTRHQAIWHDMRSHFEVPPFTLSTFIELRDLGLAYVPEGKRFHILMTTAMTLACAVADHLVKTHNVHAPYTLGRTGPSVTLKCTCNWGCSIRAGDNMQAKIARALSGHLNTLKQVDELRTALAPREAESG